MTRTRPRVGPLASTGVSAPALDVDALLDDPGTGIIVCCGSGGVGKTTTSAALALRAAERGRKVVVLTIDPARRLAQSMGIEELDNIPRPVAKVRAAKGGTLDAMMLDMKRTFDEVVESGASPEKAQQILENPFYIALSSSFAGTQEYMAMEKLGQLHRQAQEDGSYDLIVVDTPPSRSALDFLDAPERLSSFLDGRFIRLLLAPAKGPARFMTAGLGVITGALSKILGAQFLRDMQTFVAALDTLFGGFRARAEGTFALLQADGTAFLVIAAPEPDALREAAYFVERLNEDRMPLAGLVVNRASPRPRDGPERRRGDGGRRPAAQAGPGLSDRRPAPAARGPDAPGRAREPAAATLRGGAPGGAHRGGAGARDRRARPGRPAPGRGAAGGTLTRRRAPRTRSERRGNGLVVLAGVLQHVAPRRVGPAAQQRPALALGHAAPHAPLDLVVEGLREALGPHRAAVAQLLGLVLLRATDEQLVRLRLSARGRRRPVFNPHDVPTSIPLGGYPHDIHSSEGSTPQVSR